MLTLLEGTNSFVVYWDSSRVGLCCVFKQYGKVVGYATIELNVYEKNYPTHDLKVAVKIWRQYLFRVHVDLLTDHKTKKYVLTQKDLNLRQKSCLEHLKDYDMNIHLTFTYALSHVTIGNVLMWKKVSNTYRYK